MSDLTQLMYEDERVWPPLADFCAEVLGFKDGFQGAHNCRLRLIDGHVYLELHGGFDWGGHVSQYPEAERPELPDYCEWADDEIVFTIMMRLDDRTRVVDRRDPTIMVNYVFVHQETGYGLDFVEFHGDHDCRVVKPRPAGGHTLSTDKNVPWVAAVMHHVDVLNETPYNGYVSVKENLHLASSALEAARIYLLAQDPSRDDLGNLNRAIEALSAME